MLAPLFRSPVVVRVVRVLTHPIVAFGLFNGMLWVWHAPALYDATLTNEGTTGYLTSIGLPRPIAYLVCFFEFLGGIGLIFGFLTRLAALAVLIVMIGAIAKVHRKHGFFLNWELAAGRGHGYEANLAFVAMAVACLMAGGGSLALDSVLAK